MKKKVFAGVALVLVAIMMFGSIHVGATTVETVEEPGFIEISGETTAKHTDIKSYTVVYNQERPEDAHEIWVFTGADVELLADPTGKDTATVMFKEIGTVHIKVCLVNDLGEAILDENGECIQASLDVKATAESGDIINFINKLLKKIIDFIRSSK